MDPRGSLGICCPFSSLSSAGRWPQAPDDTVSLDTTKRNKGGERGGEVGRIEEDEGDITIDVEGKRAERVVEYLHEILFYSLLYDSLVAVNAIVEIAKPEHSIESFR